MNDSSDPTRPDDPVAVFLQAYTDTVWRKDADGFAACFAPDVEVFDAWDEWRARGRDAVLAMARGWFQSLGDLRVEVEFTDIRGHVDKQVAAVSAMTRYSAVTDAGTRLRSQHNRASFVLQRQADGTWLVVHQHSSVPVGFASKQAVSCAGATSSD